MPDQRRLPSLLRNAQRDGRRRSEKVLRGSSVKRKHLTPKGIEKLHRFRAILLLTTSVPASVRALPPESTVLAAAAVLATYKVPRAKQTERVRTKNEYVSVRGYTNNAFPRKHGDV